MSARRDPIGVVLAGGVGRRIGGAKAVVALRGRPLIRYPLEAMKAVLADVAVLAKTETKLPSLPGVPVWIEPAGPTHPLYGITQALVLARGRPVVVCATDLPFVSPALIEQLISDPGPAAVVAASCGEMQPLLGCYHPQAAELLTGRGPGGQTRLVDAVAAIEPRLVEVSDPEILFNVNAPEDLLRAAAMLDRRGATSRR